MPIGRDREAMCIKFVAGVQYYFDRRRHQRFREIILYVMSNAHCSRTVLLEIHHNHNHRGPTGEISFYYRNPFDSGVVNNIKSETHTRCTRGK